MSQKSEIVWDPTRGRYIAIAPYRIPGRRPFLKELNPDIFRGNETPRLAEVRAAFSEINSSTFGQHARRSGDQWSFPQWEALRKQFPLKVREFATPRTERPAERQAYLNSLLVSKLGEEETRLFKRSAIDPRLVHLPEREDLSLIRNQVPKPAAPMSVARRVGPPSI